MVIHKNNIISKLNILTTHKSIILIMMITKILSIFLLINHFQCIIFVQRMKLIMSSGLEPLLKLHYEKKVNLEEMERCNQG